MRTYATCAVCGADHRPIEITPEGSRLVDPMSIIGHMGEKVEILLRNHAAVDAYLRELADSQWSNVKRLDEARLKSAPPTQPAAEDACPPPRRPFPFWGYE